MTDPSILRNGRILKITNIPRYADMDEHCPSLKFTVFAPPAHPSVTVGYFNFYYFLHRVHVLALLYLPKWPFSKFRVPTMDTKVRADSKHRELAQMDSVHPGQACYHG